MKIHKLIFPVVLASTTSSLISFCALGETKKPNKAPHAHEAGEDAHNKDENHEGAEKEKNNGHKHSEGESDHAGDSDQHADSHGEHGEEEAPANVGPDKGITEYTPDQGFKLSPEAEKNFDIKYLQLVGNGPWRVPLTALVHTGEETNIYRKRDGLYKRIDFKTLENSARDNRIFSVDLKPGDEVVVGGTGFLRIAELSVSGGMSEGHGH